MILRRENIEDIVITVVADSFGLDSATITLTTDIFAELGIDSLDAIDLAINLQDALGIEMKDFELNKYRTLEQIVAAIEVSVSRKTMTNVEAAARGQVHEHAL